MPVYKCVSFRMNFYYMCKYFYAWPFSQFTSLATISHFSLPALTKSVVWLFPKSLSSLGTFLLLALLLVCFHELVIWCLTVRVTVAGRTVVNSNDMHAHMGVCACVFVIKAMSVRDCTRVAIINHVMLMLSIM